MNKKEKFVKLVELECMMKAKADIKYRGYVLNNVFTAMFVKEESIPEETGKEELLKAVKDYVSYEMGDGVKPRWLEYEEGTF
jgi:hypothetical protein